MEKFWIWCCDGTVSIICSRHLATQDELDYLNERARIAKHTFAWHRE